MERRRFSQAEEQIAATCIGPNAEKESCNQGLAQIEQQEAGLARRERPAWREPEVTCSTEAQYEQAQASGTYSE